MKKLKQSAGLTIIGIIIALVILIYGTTITRIDPGYSGVKVSFLGSTAHDLETLPPGYYFLPPWKKIYHFPTFEQNTSWEGKECFHFQTKEGLSIHADVGLTYRLSHADIPKLFRKYRRGIDEITHVFLRNYIRDAINRFASKLEIEDLYGLGKEKFFDDVEEYLKEQLEGSGIEISRVYLMGNFHFPQEVVAALNRKIEAIQRAQQRENELREQEAEANKRIAEARGEAECILQTARAEAEKNRMLSESITEELLILELIKKWDGMLPANLGMPINLHEWKTKGLGNG